MWSSQSEGVLRGDLYRRRIVRIAGLAAFVVALAVVVPAIDTAALVATGRRALQDPVGLAFAVVAYAAAFLLRAWVWHAVLPDLSVRHGLAALHTSLAANHVLPLRLGEAVRVADVVRRAKIAPQPAAASTLLLRTADVVAVLALAALLAPNLLRSAQRDLLGDWIWPLAAVGAVVLVAATVWLRRLLPIEPRGGPRGGPRGRLALALSAALAAWVLESAMLWRAAEWAGFSVTPLEAVLVTALTIAAQVVAIAPGGFGTYEAAATAAFVALGAPADLALAAALAAHVVKTAYALLGGTIALFLPSPGLVGAFRLPRRVTPRPAPAQVDGPVVLFLPAHNEEASVAEVVSRAPTHVLGRPVEVLVIDDGSADRTAEQATLAGARVVRHDGNQGLGAAVRTGLAQAVQMGAAAVAFCDADGEYAPEELDRLVEPILAGEGHYVVGSRFAGQIRHMRPHRRFGNVMLTGLLRWVSRTPITDGQTGYRAFSREAAAAAEVLHDYNYAQVITLDLLAKGFGYREVPIGYAFRQTGVSFVRPGRYLRHVVPAVHRQLNRA